MVSYKISDNLALLIRSINKIFYHFIATPAPFKFDRSPMITSPDGKKVILVGGYNANADKVSNNLIEYAPDSKKWTILGQKLKYGRYGSVAILFPNSRTSCTVHSFLEVMIGTPGTPTPPAPSLSPSTICQCDRQANSYGKGNCETEKKGRAFCYVLASSSCNDKYLSEEMPEYYESFEPCDVFGTYSNTL